MITFLLSAAFATTPVSLERGTVAEFDALDGVSSEAAAAIVALREQRGQLGSVEALRVVPALDVATLDVLRANTTVTVAMPMGASANFDNADQVLASFASEPTVQDLQRWANEYAQTSPELVDRWLRQSRLFGTLPKVKLEYDNDYFYDLDWDYVPGEDGPDDQLSQGAEDIDNEWGVRLEWRLERLVMSSERIRMISEAQDLVKLRDKVLSEATTVYFERRRLQVDMLLNPKADLRGQVIDQLRLMELTANLDALTGGLFSQNVKN